MLTEFGNFAAVRDLKWHYFQGTRGQNWLEASFVQQQAEKSRTGAGVPHLYALEADPREERNVVLDNLDVVAAMQKRLAEPYKT